MSTVYLTSTLKDAGYNIKLCHFWVENEPVSGLDFAEPSGDELYTLVNLVDISICYIENIHEHLGQLRRLLCNTGIWGQAVLKFPRFP